MLFGEFYIQVKLGPRSKGAQGGGGPISRDARPRPLRVYCQLDGMVNVPEPSANTWPAESPA